MIQPLWKTVWRFLKKLKIELPYDPAILLLGIYPEKTIIQKETRTTMFIAALFTVARTWNQTKCPSTDKWMKKMWHIYTVEYYSAIKRNEIELFVVRCSVIPSEVNQKEKNKYCMLTHIYGILKKEKNGSDEPRGRTGIKKHAVVENGLEDTGRGKGKLGHSERVAWTYIQIGRAHV